ncbi:MAG: CCA tRNA nucleotidyltransferase [Myxococcota bacterium]
MDPKLVEIARAVRAAGGRALAVGGYVRDQLRGEESKDCDVEVFGLDLAALERVLGGFGDVIAVGRAFGVLQIKGLTIDFSLPRRDSKVATGHKGFDVAFDPGLDFASAARRRDLTINSIGLDPLTGEILDPHGGRADLERRVLRATDAAHFPEDPLRGLRVAQFAARFEMTPDPELVRLCRALDLSELSAERVLEEWRKLLLKGARPSLGLEFLRTTALIRFTPELASLIGVAQDPEWHPEGDCWVHNQLVIDEAARLRDGGSDDAALMFGALLHDVGKPPTTVIEAGRVRSPSHDVSGVALAQAFLARMRAPLDLIASVSALVEHHLAPALFVKQGSTAKAYRRLARKLGAAGASAELLVRVARADHLGRTTDEAVARVFPAGDEFLARARELTIERRPPQDAVLGRHLIARGLKPGVEFGEILERCREVQDETGWTDAERILTRVLGDAR